jgi:glucokinase
MILAGDVGGTKTLLGLFEPGGERPRPIDSGVFVTLAYRSLGDMIHEFLTAERRRPAEIRAASFGVAGPVTGTAARLTNVPWLVDAAEVSARFGVPRVFLLNDLEAMAHSVPVLEPDELAVLQEGVAQPGGNAAIIAAGTGLGEALLHNVDGRFIPSPSEGGHADFCARTPDELELVGELTRMYGRAECEAVVSGPGLVNVFRFTHRGGARADARPQDLCAAIGPVASVAELPSRISAAAIDRRCDRCVRALDLFVSAYGSEAGNLALRFVATAGVYVGGGIAPKILPALERGPFLDAFRDKPPMTDLLATIPVTVILNRDAGLLGAAAYANQRDE